MRIEAYFQWLREVIEARPSVQSSDVSYDKRSTYEGFIRAELYFRDGSVLHLREYVDVETTIERLMYVYQYDNAAQGLVFRYDNTGHYRKLALATYPHHKHERSEQNVVDSPAPNLEDVLDEIESLAPLASEPGS